MVISNKITIALNPLLNIWIVKINISNVFKQEDMNKHQQNDNPKLACCNFFFFWPLTTSVF